MSPRDTVGCDVLVVGAGVAGLRAAIAAAEAGAKTAVACKSLLGKAASVLDDSPFRAPELEAWGALFDATGERAGLEALRALQYRAVALGIAIHMECSVERILVTDGRVAGAFGLQRATGEFVVFECPAVVLAAGGGERVWNPVAPADSTGDGIALAISAGSAHGLHAAGGGDLERALESGLESGLAAARHAETARRIAVDRAQVADCEHDALRPFSSEGGENPYALLCALQAEMSGAASLERLRELERRVAGIRIAGPRAWNPAWHLALELRSMLAFAQAVVVAEYREPTPPLLEELKRWTAWRTAWPEKKPAFASGAATPAAAPSQTTA